MSNFILWQTSYWHRKKLARIRKEMSYSGTGISLGKCGENGIILYYGGAQLIDFANLILSFRWR
jgi:hypothetical protein